MTSTPLPTPPNRSKVSASTIASNVSLQNMNQIISHNSNHSYGQHITVSSTSVDNILTLSSTSQEILHDVTMDSLEWNGTLLSNEYPTTNQQSPENLIWGIDNTVSRSTVVNDIMNTVYDE